MFAQPVVDLSEQRMHRGFFRGVLFHDLQGGERLGQIAHGDENVGALEVQLKCRGRKGKERIKCIRIRIKFRTWDEHSRHFASFSFETSHIKAFYQNSQNKDGDVRRTCGLAVSFCVAAVRMSRASALFVLLLCACSAIPVIQRKSQKEMNKN